jgi:hypothetical protein
MDRIYIDLSSFYRLDKPKYKVSTKRFPFFALIMHTQEFFPPMYNKTCGLSVLLIEIVIPHSHGSKEE